MATLHAYLGLLVYRTRNFIAYVGLTSVGSGPTLEVLGSAAPSSAPNAAALARELGATAHRIEEARNQARYERV